MLNCCRKSNSVEYLGEDTEKRMNKNSRSPLSRSKANTGASAENTRDRNDFCYSKDSKNKHDTNKATNKSSDGKTNRSGKAKLQKKALPDKHNSAKGNKGGRCKKGDRAEWGSIASSNFHSFAVTGTSRHDRPIRRTLSFCYAPMLPIKYRPYHVSKRRKIKLGKHIYKKLKISEMPILLHVSPTMYGVHIPRTYSTIAAQDPVNYCTMIQMKNFLKVLYCWNFNIFYLDRRSNGHSLSIVLDEMFSYYDLFKNFSLDYAKARHTFMLIERSYHQDNSYHNSIHGADVTQAMFVYLHERKFDEFSSLDRMICILSAACHDMDHPGVTQGFLINMHSPIAALYRKNGVLENHHARYADSIFAMTGIFDHLGPPTQKYLKTEIREMILATDIGRQKEFLDNFILKMETSGLHLESAKDRSLVMKIAIKCADISNPCRSWIDAKIWGTKFLSELRNQTRMEQQFQLPLTSKESALPKVQIGFINFVCYPLFKEWNRYNNSDLSRLQIQNLGISHRLWTSMITVEEIVYKAAYLIKAHDFK